MCTTLKFHIYYLFLHLVMLPLSNNEINFQDIIAALADLAFGCTLFDTLYQLLDFFLLALFLLLPWLYIWSDLQIIINCQDKSLEVLPHGFLRSITNFTSVIICIWVDGLVLYWLVSTSSSFIEVHIILSATKIIGSLFSSSHPNRRCKLIVLMCSDLRIRNARICYHCKLGTSAFGSIPFPPARVSGCLPWLGFGRSFAVQKPKDALPFGNVCLLACLLN